MSGDDGILRKVMRYQISERGWNYSGEYNYETKQGLHLIKIKDYLL